MNKSWMRLPLASFGIVIGALSATAQSPTPEGARCPGGYWLMEAICVNGATGDVVMAAPAAGSRIAFAPGCAPGYRRLDRLCHDAATGDVELFDENEWPAEKRPEGRN